MTDHSETEEFELLDQLAEQFALQRREGIVETIDDFVAKHPKLAQNIIAGEIERILPRVPERMGDYLRKLVGDLISTEKRPLESEIQFPWDQSAYAEFAWRLVCSKKD